ncbi:stabilin-2 [Thalassophryne amazonica]|uniref:stabilin-2 n=1 Tax=Thalassophryne amazonica TaxID=390379 RepID=UPI00147170BF|nr:stabilin-2 [Thalassophryne amazonica]
MASTPSSVFVSLTMTMMMTMMMTTRSAPGQNFCTNTTVLRTQTTCRSCSLNALTICPAGFTKNPTPEDCSYYIRTASLKLAIKGCSFVCSRQVEQTSCCPGYWGQDCIECPENADKPCNNNGRCLDGMGGNGTCSCKVGFAGFACEDCEPNRYGPSCSSVCRCVHGLCLSGLKGHGSCLCFSGYQGLNCDQESPECSALRCQQNARCMEDALSRQLMCQCLPGYQYSGGQCVSINPCLQQVCHAHATCAHTGPNKHLCNCNEGYRGDGRVCMAIDRCQTNYGGCSADSTHCVNDGPGKSHCECLYGFHDLQDGVRCSLRDSCKPSSCHRNANCSTVAPYQVECTCLQGYIGNGKVCYGNIMQRLNDLNTEPDSQWRGQLTSSITLFGSVSWSLQNLGPFTVFVPINKGFKGTSVKSLTSDLSKAKYLCNLHIVAGMMPFDSLKKTDVYYTLTGKSAEMDTSEGDTQTKIRIHGSRKKGVVIQSDVIASNGVIHIINKLMDSVSATVDSERQENLMKIISDYGKFDTFKSLLQKVDMLSLMDMAGPYTVFAPTSFAFDTLQDGYLQYFSSPQGHTKLLELLRNHVVPSTALDIYNAASNPRIMTSANQILVFNVTGNGQILVNGAAVVEADVEAKNGRLYVLDGVLIPASIEPVLPHRCDLTVTEIISGPCMSCSKIKLMQCTSGVFTGSNYGCDYMFSISSPGFNFPLKGCSPLCNITSTTPACCKGFYGPDCSPCPGGFQKPCSGHGQCVEGITGNGTCICEPNFRGSRCQYCSNANKYGPSCDRVCGCIHGLCDNRPDADGRCKVDSCLSGYTGPYCERQTQACGIHVQFCHAHADCDFSQGAQQCVCKSGYQGDGITCVELDPCAPPQRGGCSVNAECIKTGPSTHRCQCLSGWTEDGDECRPINICDGPDRGGCHVNATCISVGPGQRNCMCKADYTGNGRDCEPLNQCVLQTGGCHYLADCRLISGQWKCVCEDGYAGDGKICYGTVEQELMTLPDVSEFLTWITDSGLSQILSEQNITLLVPSSAAVAKMSSEDKKFWTLKGNLPSLLRNHMIPGNYPSSSLSSMSSVTSLLRTTLPLSTNQSTVVGGATITISNIAATNGLIHLIDKVLVPDQKLSDGLLASLALRTEFSLFRSYLIEHNLTNEFTQSDWFTVFAPTDAAVTEYLTKMAATSMDINTTRYHVVASERLQLSDLQSGGYKQTLLGFSFQLGFFPRDGKVFVNEAQINVSDILSGNGVIHGVTAVLQIKRNRCDDISYDSVRGLCLDCVFPRDNVCPNGLTPDKSAQTMPCLFKKMLNGKEVLALGCRTNCMKSHIVPLCCSGYFGEHCERCPGPKGQPCFGNGLCMDGINGMGICRCNKGFNGTACETCNSNKYGVHCDQECLCKNGDCNDGPNGDGTCECDLGWKGILCDEKIESAPDELCGSVKCHTSANCVLSRFGPRCLCSAGFQGNGTICTAKNACAVNNGGCSLYAICKRTRPGRRDCVCNYGYTGDGLVCVEINPCLKGNGGCHVNADCVHIGPNKTSCVCNQHYSGDGLNCELIDICKKKNGDCHRLSKCNMTGPGVRTCTCPKNYIGDGLSCKGSVARELLIMKLRGFYMSLVVADINLRGRGPYTVFAPSEEAYAKDRQFENKMKALQSKKNQQAYLDVVCNHIVLCHTLLPGDLSQPRNLTALSGRVLTTSSIQGSLFLNNVNVMYNNEVAVNGIIHEVDTILFPPDIDNQKDSTVPLNLTDIANLHGYKVFYKLLEDAGVMDLINYKMYQPVTIFLPSDSVMASLPQKQKDFLYHQDNRPQLLEYLKYHILKDQKVNAAFFMHMEAVRTLQGSTLSFSCGGIDNIGEIFINGGTCRIIQRHLLFSSGIAYGIDCLLTPPSLGGRCDEQISFEMTLKCGLCASLATRCPHGSKQKEVHKCDLPYLHMSSDSSCRTICTVNSWQPKCCPGYYGRDCLVCPGGLGFLCSKHGKCDDGHFGNGTCTCDPGFHGVACELCAKGFFGPTCKACNCTEHGSCDDGRKGTGSCFCDVGWTGKRCETPQAEIFVCSPPCSPKAVCQENNTCVCRPFYEGDGFTCTVIDVCQIWNGGCAAGAKCSQTGQEVTCTCPPGHSGDGFSCQPIDPCASGDNGGCHEHAICTMMAPGKKSCSCKDGYIGDGVTCEVKQLPISRCFLNNGQCHQDAVCTDLHFEDKTVGVFHLRSDRGHYKLNFSAAQQLCRAEGGTLATYTQLSYAQQGGMHLCAAGWLDQARVAYPTTYSSPNCGGGHVGIVDYGVRKNLSETWDTFCYRLKEIQCECRFGFVGDGFICYGNLWHVLGSTPTFSNFLTQILNSSLVSDSGKRLVRILSDPTVQSTLFVPDNSGLPGNQTLSQRDIEFHLLEGQALLLGQLKNGMQIKTRLGSLTVIGVRDLLDPSALSSCYINDRFVISSNIVGSNGVIHVLQGPLKAPPPQHQLHASHRAGLGVGLILLVLLVGVVIFVAYRFYNNTIKPFHFHYFKDSEEETAPPADCSRNVCNPVYDAAAERAASHDDVIVEDKHEVENSGSYDLLHD